jgi:TetR/AcrR family transcriptional repressor of bet genes
LKTSIEKIRRQDLVRAAYRTFLEHGLNGMTMARIGERAGMSHGIVNYYFKSKDELLDAMPIA